MYKLLNEEKNYLKELKEVLVVEDYLLFLEESDIDEYWNDVQELYLSEAPKLVDIHKKLDHLRGLQVRTRALRQQARQMGNKDLVAQHTKTLEKIQKDYDIVGQQMRVLRGKGSMVDKVAVGAREVGGKVAKGAKELASKPEAKYAAAAVVAAAAAVAAYKIYKRFFSQAAKACKGKSGSEKTACMNQYKIKGLKAAQASLKTSVAKCSKDKNPDKCKATIQKKILKHDAKIKKLSG